MRGKVSCQKELIEKIHSRGQVPKAGEKVSILTVSFPLSYPHLSCIVQRDTLHQFSNLGLTSVGGSDLATSWRLSSKRAASPKQNDIDQYYSAERAITEQVVTIICSTVGSPIAQNGKHACEYHLHVSHSAHLGTSWYPSLENTKCSC